MSICTHCKSRPTWYDSSRKSFSLYCSNTCRNAATIVYKPQIAHQGQPLCRLCDNASFYDKAKNSYSPGCTKNHALSAIKQGFTSPR